MVVSEKGHAFMMDSILGNNKAPSARHILPLTVPTNTGTHGRAVPVRRNPKTSTSPGAPSPPLPSPPLPSPPLVSPPVYTILTTPQPAPYVDFSDVTLSRKRHRSDEDDQASVTSADSGRSSPDDLSSGSSTCDGKIRKKARTSFSTEQVTDLESYFQAHKYVTTADREELSERLQLSELQIKTWFQNRRMKDRRSRANTERTATFPTGGVDVSQLQALGLPCPPPPRVIKRNRRRNNAKSQDTQGTQPIEPTMTSGIQGIPAQSQFMFPNPGMPVPFSPYGFNGHFPYMNHYSQMTVPQAYPQMQGHFVNYPFISENSQ